MNAFRSLTALAQTGPVVHPFLFAVYPILFLWSNNRDELSLYSSKADLILPMVISVGLAAVLLGLSGLILRNWRRAGVLVAFILLLFFSYGHFQQAIADIGEFGYVGHRYMVSMWTVLFLAGGFLIFRFRSGSPNFANMLNIISFVLILFTLPNVVVGSQLTPAAADDANVPNATSNSANLGTDGTPPDIYYITLEGYDSAEVLAEFLGYDNSPFTDYLERNGFYVVPDAFSNYSSTAKSLASSLSMEHLIRVSEETSARGSHRYYQTILDSKAFQYARSHGYRIIYLRESYTPKSLPGGDDLYYGCDKGDRISLHADEFAGALLHSTATEPILRKLSILEAQQSDLRRCDFVQVVNAKDLKGPKIVYIHTLIPGEPFVLDANGVPISASTPSNRFYSQYLDQVTFTNKMLKPVIDSLLSDQENPPVIIIQGDHGQDPVGETKQLFYRRALGILNAYYLPRGGNEVLYPTVSPVNTFRIVFNYYLGADFELLDDSIYFSDQPDKFIDVTGIVR